ncbi:hypothetical protein Tco_0519989 [Tanacetum coccineum]
MDFSIQLTLGLLKNASLVCLERWQENLTHIKWKGPKDYLTNTRTENTADRIIAHRTPPYTPQHNGVSEEEKQNPTDMVRSNDEFNNSSKCPFLVLTLETAGNAFSIWFQLRRLKRHHTKPGGYLTIDLANGIVKRFLKDISQDEVYMSKPEVLSIQITRTEYSATDDAIAQTLTIKPISTESSLRKVISNESSGFLATLMLYDLNGMLMTSKTHTGYCFVLNGGALIGIVPKQSIFAYFSCRADYIAAFDASKEGPNESGITKGARHFCAKVHYLREVIEFGDIKLEKVHTDDNLAETGTKALDLSAAYSYELMVNLIVKFQHKCTLRPRTEEEKEKVNIAGNKGKSKEGYTEVRNGKSFNGFGGNFNRRQDVYQGTRIGIVKTMCVHKVPGGKDNMEKLKRSAYKYAVLAEVNEENNRKNNDEIMIDKRLIVDEFVKKKQQPSVSETKDWSYDMIKYFKYAWEAREKGEHDDSDEEDVEVVYDESVQSVIANEVESEGGELRKYIVEEKLQMLAILETHLKTKNIAKIVNSVFGSWNWLSNVDQSPTSCRIIVGWNNQVVKVMVLHVSKQSVLCLVETIPDKIKFYVSIVYASNNGNERRELWTSL